MSSVPYARTLSRILGKFSPAGRVAQIMQAAVQNPDSLRNVVNSKLVNTYMGRLSDAIKKATGSSARKEPKSDYYAERDARLAGTYLSRARGALNGIMQRYGYNGYEYKPSSTVTMSTMRYRNMLPSEAQRVAAETRDAIDSTNAGYRQAVQDNYAVSALMQSLGMAPVNNRQNALMSTNKANIGDIVQTVASGGSIAPEQQGALYNMMRLVDLGTYAYPTNDFSAWAPFIQQMPGLMSRKRAQTLGVL